jgi:HEAT repeat protein
VVRVREEVMTTAPLVVIEEAERAERLNPALFQLAARTDSQIREAVAAAVGCIGDPAGWPILLRLLEDPRPEVRARAAFASHRLVGAPPESLLKMLRRRAEAEEDALVLRALLFALSRLDRSDGALARLGIIHRQGRARAALGPRCVG